MQELEEKIKALLRYSFIDGDEYIHYMWLTDEESDILSPEDYDKLKEYLSK